MKTRLWIIQFRLWTLLVVITSPKQCKRHSICRYTLLLIKRLATRKTPPLLINR
uniref:Uncharacterized protein n=1 Tax=uncultured marine virus TaxID=186617 RepID=A0A0F7L791_9VIRU|nr:hypothetical protein [uncultured marine virus]